MRLSSLFQINGNEITYGGQVVATRISDGIGLNALVIEFNALATRQIAQKFIFGLRFRTVNSSLMDDRVLSVQSAMDAWEE